MEKRLLTFEEIQKIETAMLEQVHKICKENGIKYTLVCGSTLGAIRHGGPVPWDSDVDIGVAWNEFDRFCDVFMKELPDWAVLDGYKTTQKGYYRFFPRIAMKGVDSRFLHLDVFFNVGLPDSRQLQEKYSKESEKLKKMYFYKEKPLGFTVSKSRNSLVWFAKKVIEFFAKVALLPISIEKIYDRTEKHFNEYPYEQAKYVMNPTGHYGMKNVLEKRFYEDLIEVKYDGIDVNVQRDYDEYLTHYYGEWKTPHNDFATEPTVYIDKSVDLSKIIGK